MLNVTAATLMQHLLFLFFLVVAPTWDLYATPKLKRNPTSENKIRYYKAICIPLWIAGALALIAVGFGPLFSISPSPGEISWLLLHAWVRYLVEAMITIFFIISVALPIGVIIWKKLTHRPHKYSSAALKSLSCATYTFFPGR